MHEARLESHRWGTQSCSVKRRRNQGALQLLFGPRRRDGRNGQGGNLCGEFDGVESRASGGPVFGRKFQVAVAGPLTEDAEEVPDIGLWSRWCRRAEAISENR